MSRPKHTMTVRLDWTRVRHEDRQQIEKPDGPRQYRSRMQHWGKEITEQCAGQFVVQIDLEALAREVAARCRNNRSGKSRILGGIVVAKRTQLNVNVTKTVEHPIPEGWQPRQEEQKP